MRTDDKVLFDRASKRVEESKLDDHSKEGISIALAMSGEACNGLVEEKKMETLTRAVFSLTLAVSYFMAQAPEQTQEMMDNTINAHVGNCAKLISNQEKAVAGETSELNFTLFGNKMSSKGRAATNISIVATVVFAIVGLFYYMGKLNREEIEKNIKADFHKYQNITQNPPAKD
jgi:hypothetical protein